jgi:ABC-type amino acid transport substrate-binding protein
MTAAECLALALREGDAWQRAINQFVDDFRRASQDRKRTLIEDPIAHSGKLEGLVAAVVSALCRESGMEAPEWVGHVGSDEAFFAFPAKSFEMRLRLMVESPPPFRIRNVFVPENYLSRA